MRLIGQEALSDLEEKEIKMVKLERNYGTLKSWQRFEAASFQGSLFFPAPRDPGNEVGFDADINRSLAQACGKSFPSSPSCHRSQTYDPQIDQTL